jgi:hypothetical protein
MLFGKRSARRALKKAQAQSFLEAQSVKMADQPGERGFDAGKKVKGRKRHLLVDTLGLILVAVVHSAAIQDREGAKLVIQKARWFGWLRVIFADAAYNGQLVTLGARVLWAPGHPSIYRSKARARLSSSG